MADNAALPANYYFVLDLNGVVFDGAQFTLWLSPNGFSNINTTAGSGDVQITPTFNVSSLGGPAVHIGSYYLGTDTHPFISGPVTSTSTDIPGGIYYVKLFDGLSTAVAVSSQYLIILPAITIKPTFGPAGADIKVTGHAFTAGGTVNLSIQNPLGTWLGAGYTANTTAGTLGNFSVSLASLGVRVPDLQNPAPLTVPFWYNGTIFVVANDYGTGSTANAGFSEAAREFYWIQAYSDATHIGSDTGAGAWPNATAVDGWVLQNLYISGLFFNPTNPTPTFTWDGNALTPTHLTAINSTGYFDANFTVPVSGLGPHFLKVFDATNNMTLEVDVQTTLIITPTSGPEGTTITVTGYGFTNGQNVTVYWWGTEFATPVDQGSDYIKEYTGTNITAGSFTFTFAAPSGVYGGDHDIYANDSAGIDAAGVFTVTPTWALSATSGALGSKFFVLGHGLPVGTSFYSTATTPFDDFNGDSTGADAYFYELTYDNALSYQGGFGFLSGDDTGEANNTMVAAGVPMVHYVSVVNSGITFYTIDGLFAFTVSGNTTADQQILTAIAGQTALLTGLQSSMTSLSTSVSTLTTTVNAIQTALNSLSTSQASSFTSLNTAVAGVNSAVTGLQSSMTTNFATVNSGISSLSSAMSTGFTNLNTAVGGLSGLSGKIDTVNTAVSGVSSSLSTLSGKVDTLSGTVTGIQGTIGSVKTSTDTLSNITTLLYIAIILALVAVVLEVVVLIRKK